MPATSSGLSPRSLLAHELRVDWVAPADAASLYSRYQHPSHLPFDKRRYGVCAAEKAFSQEMHAPCLRAHSGGSWASLLAGRTVAFVGDSSLRELLFALSALLATALPRANFTAAHGIYGNGHWSRMHAGTMRPYSAYDSHLIATFTHDDGQLTRLLWCYYEDERCLYRYRKALHDAALLIVGYGAHIKRPLDLAAWNALRQSGWAEALAATEEHMLSSGQVMCGLRACNIPPS